MKPFFKTAFILFLVLNYSFVAGQDTLKTFNNNWSTELNFNPFNGNLSFNNTMGQIKVRYLRPNNTALRFSVNLGFNKNNSNAENLYGSSSYKNKLMQRSLLIGLNAGKEKHFAGSRRLSPYIGWELGVGFKSSYQETKTESKTTEISGAWQTYTASQQYPNNYVTSYTERGYWALGANLVAGFDFYMSEKFFFGYEMMFGLDYTSYSDIDVTEKYNSTTGPSGSSFPDLDDESWKFGPKLINGIRIGFVF